MQTTPKANNILGHFFALLGAVVMLAIATWVSASSSEQVTPLDNLAVPRTGHTATALSDGKILITGGRDADGNLVAASEIFDPETQTSSASATLHAARVDHSAIVLLDGRVLVAGGSGASGPLSSAEIFDPANPDAGFQVVASPMTSARTRHTATLLNNGSVLIAGGETGGTAEIFDPATQLFTPTLWNLQVARNGHTATLFTDDTVLLAGGNANSMELFTPLDQKFTLDVATMSVVRTGHWAFELSDTRLLLFQGDIGNSIDEFNPTTDTITPKGSLDFHASSSTLLANGKVLVLGTDVSGLYNPDAVPPAPDFTAFDETSVPNSGILPRSGQSAVTLPGDKQILISGGVDSNNQFLGMALFDPARIWTDKDDYQPDEPVILSGSGWKANEAIYLYAVDNETEQWTYETTINADANGEFIVSPYFIVELRHLGVQFHVTALGAQSTMQADVYFTDANPGTMSLSPPSVSVNAGSTATYTATITAGGNNNPCTLTLSFAYTGTPPVGTTPSFTPNPLTMTTSNVSSTLTITTTNTGPMSGRTQPGFYNFTVTAARGANCQGSGNIVATGTLVVNGCAVGASSSNTAILCNGGPSTVTVSASGGTAPYTGTGTFSRSAGTYSFTVTDTNGCTATTTGNITQPPVLGASSTNTAILCNGGSSTVTVSASGGTAPYTGTGTFSRSAGTYSFTVTDANGCTASTTKTITQPSAVVASSSNTAILCNGGNSIVTVSATGGTGAYSGTGTFSHAAGTYSYTVTDANSCTATTTGTITQPSAVVASSSNTAILCNGGNSIVTVSATGGTGAYSGTGTFSHAAGTYSYTVTDANSCTATTTGTITQPSAVVASSSNTAILCNGGSSTVTVSATGGTSPYTGTGTFSHAAGTYSYTVTDANSCTATATGTITEPSAIVVGSSETTPILCHGGNAVITVSASGGTGTISGTGTFSHAAGTYSYTVTDANSCTATTTGTITQPSAITIGSSETTPILCNGGNAVITVTASGGTGSISGTGTFSHAAGTYSYTVTDANSCTATTTGTITEPSAITVGSSETTPILCNGGNAVITVTASGGTGSISGTGTFSHAAGTYSYTVTDANSCTATTTGTITEPSAITVGSSETTPILCNGGNAVITVTASGGTGSISGTGTFSHAAGTYSYTVTDANSCTATTTGTITQPSAITIGSSETTPILCNGGNAVITVTASGGTGSISGTGTFSHAAGTYSYTVTDANSCTATTTGTITQPNAITVGSSETTPILCNGGNAVITVTASGGTGSISGTGTFSHAAGTYSYTVTDANSCTATTTGTITQPNAITVGSSETTPILCNGGNAVITVTASGGTGSISGTGTFSHAAGTYSYTVTDANSCTATTTGTITQPSAITVGSSETTPILCNGGNAVITVSASGGTGTLQGTGTFSHAAGTYSYTVTDANSCTATTTGTITQPSAITVGSSETTPILCNGGNAVITVSASGGTGTISGTGTFSHAAGTYSYTATDANSCTATTTGTITEPTAVVASSSNTAILCNGGNSIVTVSATGGTPGYTGTGTFSVPAGPYSYTVTDANGCTATTSGTITEPTAVVASSSNTAILCNGGNSIVTVSATGGTGAYSGTGTFSHAAGTYSYTVTDANSCTATTTGTITQPSAVVASSSNTAILCNGGNSIVTVSATGGTAPYTGTGTFSRSAGTYSYTVTDANSCTATTTGTITQPSAVVATSSVMCNGGSAVVTVSATGGTPGYTGTGTFSHAAGTYSYTVTDANSCTATTTGTVTTPNIWTINGFYQPVDMVPIGVVNTVKGGSTVPLKFNIFGCDGVEKTSVSDVQGGSVQVYVNTCTAGPEEPLGDINTGATNLRYDTTGHQFIQNWQTPKGANKCYRVRMTTIDGEYIEAFFKTK